MKPPASRLTHLPPFLHTPGIQRPDDALSSQCSPMRGKKEKFSSGMCLDTVLPYWLFGLSVFILTGLFSAPLVQQVASANPVYCMPAHGVINYLSSQKRINLLILNSL